LSVAAAATTSIQLATGVVNPVVRHPAVLASAIGGIALLAGDRVVLGVGRGDSSVRVLHLQATPVAEFETCLRDLQTYLRGEYVGGEGGPHVPWLVATPGTKVPLDVAATGRRVTEMAARWADRVTLALSADPERVQWGLDVIRETTERAPFVGAAVPMAMHADLHRACEIVRGPLSVATHFAAGDLRSGAPLSKSDARLVQTLADRYDYASHSSGDSPQGRVLEEDFILRASIVGDAKRCADRIAALAELGLDRISFMLGTNPDSDGGILNEQARVAESVLALVA
jgi:5,10-methylenetetrahydromethanopterin reductase